MAMNKNIKLMQGNEAVAEGALIAGCDFFCRLSHNAVNRNSRNTIK